MLLNEVEETVVMSNLDFVELGFTNILPMVYLIRSIINKRNALGLVDSSNA